MTLCFFSAQYLPTVGGVERYTFNLAKRAVAAGHRAIVVTSALPGLPARETDENGIEIYRLPVFLAMKGRFPVLRSGPAFSALARELWAQEMDLCVVQTRMYLQSVWAARMAAKRGVKTIVIDHSTGYMPVGGGAVGLAGRLYEHWACRRIQKTGAAFYGVSQAACRWLAAFGVAPAGELPNAVQPEELCALRDAAPKKDWRAALHLAPGTRLIAFVGRLIPEKGAAQLARAVAALPGAALVIAGDGPERPALAAMDAPNVFLAGSVPYPETLRLLSQADVYCLPTRYGEGFPTTLLEAAACKCPILCTATAGTEELLPHPGCGVLLKDTDPETIRAALCAMLSDDAGRAAMADACYENLCSHFTWRIVFDKIIKIASER